jgi:hypothetical protein
MPSPAITAIRFVDMQLPERRETGRKGIRPSAIDISGIVSNHIGAFLQRQARRSRAALFSSIEGDQNKAARHFADRDARRPVARPP